MEKIYISKPGTIGAVMHGCDDGGVLYMYSTAAGKVFKKSRDYGNTFDEEWTVALGTITANANVLSLKNGELIMPLKKKPENPRAAELGGADFNLVYSGDNGKTWGKEQRISETSGCFYLMNGRLIRLSTGRMLIPLCYHPDEFLDRANETAGWCGCRYSDNEGESWEQGAWLTGKNVDGHLAEPMVIELPGGELKMFMRTGFGYLYESVSQDRGATWSPEKPTTLRSPCAPFCVQTDPYSGFVFTVWNNSFPATPKHQYPRSPLCLAVSRDGTKSWEFVMYIENDAMSNYGYPSMYFTQDSIIAVYYENKGERSFNPSRQCLKQVTLYRKNINVQKTISTTLFQNKE